MLKKTITYTNPFTNEEVSEEHYFHISKADLVEMEMEEHAAEYVLQDGTKVTGMQAKLQKIVDSQDGKAIMAEFKDIIRRAYGKKDGDRFLKSREISADFMASEAFSQLLFDLTTKAEAAAEFINGIVPGNLEQIVRETQEIAEKEQVETPMGPRPAVSTEAKSEESGDPTGLTADTSPRVLTPVELREMDANELQAGLADGRYKLS